MDGKTVISTEKLTNEQLGGLQRRFNEIMRRLNEGTINYEWAMRELQRIIEGGETSPSQKFPVWKTIKIGTSLKTADQFRQAIKLAGYKISDWANDILGKPAFYVNETEMDIDLVNVSVEELGFPQGATRRKIYNRAEELELSLCPNETGAQLRLQYTYQTKGEWLVIAMEPITDSGGGLGLFTLGHDSDDPCLGGNYGYPDGFWDGNDRFLFRRRK